MFRKPHLKLLKWCFVRGTDNAYNWLKTIWETEFDSARLNNFGVREGGHQFLYSCLKKPKIAAKCTCEVNHTTRGRLSASWFALWKIYNENVTLENSNLGVFYSFGEKVSSSFFKLWRTKGPETNKEPAPYTKIEIQLHKTLHSFVAESSILKFAVGNRNSWPLPSQRSF